LTALLLDNIGDEHRWAQRSSFEYQGKQISVLNKQTDVCRFRFSFVASFKH
jgi:hypothetical protein